MTTSGDHAAEPLGWSYHNPVQLHFGVDARAKAVKLAAAQNVLIVASPRGRTQFEADPILKSICDGAVAWVDDVQTNPDLEALSRLQTDPALQDVSCIIAFGGGSALDSAKAIAAMIACGPSGFSLAEIIARPAVLDTLPCPPIHCLPTTSGTGAEVTPFATVWDHQARKKLSLAHPALYPATAIVDPVLTLGLPPSVTLSTGLDALNQAFESVWNRNATPLTLQMAAVAIEKGLRALPRLMDSPDDLSARSDMAEASLLAGLCISQTRTALCHSISYPLTAHFGVPHGLACAFTMMAVADDIGHERPDLLEQLARPTGSGSGQDFVKQLKALLAYPDVRDSWQSLIASPQAVLRLMPEMVTPGRADNYVLAVDECYLKSVLERSLVQS